MFKKIFPFIFLFIFSNSIYAETCPTIFELKQDLFREKGWQVLNINSGEPLSDLAWKKMKPHIKEFMMARWMPDAPEGSGQCYYKDNNAEFELEFYVVKNTLAPDATSKNWYYASYGVLQCELSLKDCCFKDQFFS